MNLVCLAIPESDEKPIRRKITVQQVIPLKYPLAHGGWGGLGAPGKHTKAGNFPHCIDACLPAAEAISELSWKWRLEPATDATLPRSCLFSVLEEQKEKARDKSIAWQQHSQ